MPVLDRPQLGGGSFESAPTLGIAIVGMAQAGKTTFRDIIRETWAHLDPDSDVIDFSNSNGFRGLTATILESSGVNYDTTVSAGDFEGYKTDYLGGADVCEIAKKLDGLYSRPLKKSVLRSPAVDSVVAHTSEDTVLRPLVNAAGARHLRHLVCPNGVDRNIGLVVLDARNQDECIEKFQAAAVIPAATFVLECDEHVVARRQLGPAASAAAILDLEIGLRDRNWVDRHRSLGRMTLGCDLDEKYDVGVCEGYEDDLRAVGYQLPANPLSGVVVDTTHISLSDERYAARHIIEGVLTAL